jgi:hypothetical protein
MSSRLDNSVRDSLVIAVPSEPAERVSEAAEAKWASMIVISACICAAFRIAATYGKAFCWQI